MLGRNHLEDLNTFSSILKYVIEEEKAKESLCVTLTDRVGYDISWNRILSRRQMCFLPLHRQVGAWKKIKLIWRMRQTDRKCLFCYFFSDAFFFCFVFVFYNTLKLYKQPQTSHFVIKQAHSKLNLWSSKHSCRSQQAISS